MEKNKVFRLIWRFNAIIIMGTGLLAIAVLGFSALSILGSITRERQVSNVVNLNQESEIEEDLRFGEVREITATPYLMLPLSSHQSYDRASYQKTTDSTRNFLFFNSETGKRHWLLESNEYLIISDNTIAEPTLESQPNPVLAILYSIVKEDTDENKTLNNNDLFSIALSKPDGLEYREILTDIKRILGYKVIDRETLVLFYQKENKAYFTNVSFNDFSFSQPEELPTVGKN
ncbi:hypothetical protein [Spirulina sp. 06S082]|uniref:hypothetical protein n=1 Tax=Spirulina sp. 06S082 TaxID=3110248 RepID=UPI002B21772C|nr:hypothetical protein [Spirulina sp. 06S082]MEA5467927.1 hypothetical protein [Spirulina sp. 06S082]